MTVLNALITIAVVAVCTFLTRLAPFALFGRKDPPDSVMYLGKVLPAAVIAVLVVYCLRNISFYHAADWMPMFIAIVITAALHIWKKNNLLSIGGGTVCYMVMVQAIFS
ncbi:MAG: AzlD domain-containing protein [Eubacteriaceae bacterium]|nr:AzlD domain-containing protein [Eubacteriaceae bacterium]